MKHLIFLGAMVLAQMATAYIEKPEEPVYEICAQPPVMPTKPTCTQVFNDNCSDLHDKYDADLAAYNTATDKFKLCTANNTAKKNGYEAEMAEYNVDVNKLSQIEQAQLQLDQKANKINSSVDKAMYAYEVAKAGAAVAESEQTRNRRKAQRLTWMGVVSWPWVYHYWDKSHDARDRKNEAIAAANAACSLAIKLSATGAADCTEITPATPGTVDLLAAPQYDAATGKCLGSTDQCVQDAGAPLLPGINVKSPGGGLSAMASSSKPLLKVNPDGSVTTRDGKKLTKSIFASEAAMVAAGMTPAEAKSLMAHIKKSSSEAEKAALTALDNEKKAFVPTYSSDAPMAGKTTEVILNGNAAREKEMLGSGSSEKREVASVEGLAKDFNGEQIGVSGDDIFKMMNRRYKLKATQDNFIAP